MRLRIKDPQNPGQNLLDQVLPINKNQGALFTTSAVGTSVRGFTLKDKELTVDIQLEDTPVPGTQAEFTWIFNSTIAGGVYVTLAPWITTGAKLDWGDGLVESDVVGTLSHIYAAFDVSYKVTLTVLVDGTVSQANKMITWDNVTKFAKGETNPSRNPHVSIPELAKTVTAGTPGSFGPLGSRIPEDIGEVQKLSPDPLTGWTTGQYVMLGNGGPVFWADSSRRWVYKTS